jgi:hypothetical protein
VGRRLPLPVNSHREPLSWRVRGAKTMLPPSSRTEIEETREKAANSAANGKKLRTRRMGLRLPSRSRPLMTPINLSARSPRKSIRYSGKSLLLREIEQDISSHASVATKIVSDFEIVWIKDGADCTHESLSCAASCNLRPAASLATFRRKIRLFRIDMPRVAIWSAF